MIVELICFLIVGIACFVIMLRIGILYRLLPDSLAPKILAEMDSLKVSAPSLKSTSDRNSSLSK